MPCSTGIGFSSTPSSMSIAAVLLILVTASALTGGTIPDAVNYTSTLIRYLADRHTGVFDCWFYLLENSNEDALLQQILSVKELQSVPKRILYSLDGTDVLRAPQLVLLFCGDCSQVPESFYRFLFDVPFAASTKFVMLHRCTFLIELLRFGGVFIHAKLLNFVYIRIDDLKGMYQVIYRREVHVFEKDTSFKNFIVDQTADLSGTTVQVFDTLTTIDTIITQEKDKFNGRVVEWFTNTIRHLNGTALFQRPDCEHLNSFECGKRTFLLVSKLFHDICADEIITQDLSDVVLYSMLPGMFLVAAPSGRKLTVYEVFVMPFNAEVWIALLILILSCSLIMCLFPELFDNDIVLLSFCGFECRNLHRVSHLEKIAVMSLTVFNFFLFKAYETKIITFMTSFPYMPSPRTLDDLIRANITIYVLNNESFGINGNSQLDQVFKFSLDPNLYAIDAKLDNVGHSANAAKLHYGIYHPRNYDSVAKRSKFVILDRFAIGNHIVAYFTGYRNPLADKLRLTEAVFFEAGLMELWTRSFYFMTYGVRHMNLIAMARTSEGSAPESKILGMAELGPVCLMLFVGLSLATVVFMVELVISLISRFVSKKLVVIRSFLRSCILYVMSVSNKFK